MRKTLPKALFFGLFLLVTCQWLVAQEVEPLRITHGPCLLAPRETSATLVWFTNKKCVSWVEYGEGAELRSKAIVARHGLLDADQTRHAVQIDGLEPGKTYRYRVVSREIVKFAPYKVDYGPTVTSPTYSFQACDPRPKPFSFSVIADIHEHADLLKKTLDATVWRGVDLVLSGHTHKAAHHIPQDGVNRYHLAIGFPCEAIRVDVTRENMSVSWSGPTPEMPKPFTIPRPNPGH